MYSDECTFDTSKRGLQWATRMHSERYHDDCIQHTFPSSQASVGVWGAISYNMKSELVFLNPAGKKGITCNDYLEQVLKPVVGPAFQGQKGYKKGDPGVCMLGMEQHDMGSKRSCKSLKKSWVIQGMIDRLSHQILIPLRMFGELSSSALKQ